MKKRKNTTAKVIAFLALFGIVVSVIGTGLIIIFDNGNETPELTPQQIQELQELMNAQSGSTATGAISK